jgi:hypothetical protein
MNRRRKFRKKRNDPRWLIKPLWPQDSTSADLDAQRLTLEFIGRLGQDLLHTSEAIAQDLPLDLMSWVRTNPAFCVALSPKDMRQLVDEASVHFVPPADDAPAEFMGMPVRESDLVPDGMILLVEQVPAAEAFFRQPKMCVIKNVGMDSVDRIDPVDGG